MLTLSNYTNKHINQLLIPTKLYFNIRFMIKKGTQIVINSNDHLHVARATHRLLKNITSNEVVEGIVCENPRPLFNGCLDYIVDNRFSNILTRANLLTGTVKDRIPLESLSQAFINKDYNPKLFLYSKEGVRVPSRIFCEIGIAKTHIDLYSECLDRFEITADQVKVNSKTNSQADYLSYFDGVYKYNDAKAGSAMIERPLGGTIGQLTYFDGIQCSTPNNFIDLFKFNLYRKELLLKNHKKILSECEFSIEQKDYFETQLQVYFNIPMTLDTILEKHYSIEYCLYKIQALPKFNKAISFINVINNISETNPITPEESIFIKAIFPSIHPNMFANARTLRRFLQKSLIVYKTEIDRKAILDLEKTKGCYWMPTFLDDIDITIFL